MITFDFETKSFADLKKVGAWAYAQDPTTDVICACWGIDSEDIQEWWPDKYKTNDIPDDLYQALFLPSNMDAICSRTAPDSSDKAMFTGDHLIEAHNCSFEMAIWRHVMNVKYDWPEPYLDRWRDTMAVASYYAMPAALDRLLRAIGFPGKDPEGGRLITKYSKLYLKTAKTTIPPEDFAKFVKYCRHDVACEQSVSDWLGDLPERELAKFLLYLRISIRGLALDTKGIAAATEVVTQRAQTLTVEFKQLTKLKPTQGMKLLVWFKDQGLSLENLQVEYLQELLDEDLPTGPTRRALEIRLRINKASTKKLDAMSRQLGIGKRARFQTRYHGAVTGRETGSGFQPLNLNRGYDGMDPAQLTRDIMYRDVTYLDALYGDATDAVAKASRYWIKAQSGNKIMAGDYASVEAVILACLAGETWKIDAFREGVKIYESMADKIYSLAPGTVTKETHPQERQDGKTGELAFGYQGALGAWLKFDASGRHSDKRIIEICKAWRAEHPQIVALWAGLQDAALAAVFKRDGAIVSFRAIAFEVVDEWLTMILPNGKRLWYFKPEIRMIMPQWHKPHSDEKCAMAVCDCKRRPTLTYMAQKAGQWIRVHTYGGKLTENLVQAMSREILEAAKQRLAAAYDPPLIEVSFLKPDESSIILTIYDEIIVEVPEEFSTEAEMEGIMQQVAGEWAEEWPITAKVWTGERYKK